MPYSTWLAQNPQREGINGVDLIVFIAWCILRTYVFKVKLKYDKRVWRKIEVLGSQTLNHLHLAIQEAFSFDADHLYSFFMSGKAWGTCDYEYCHPQALESPLQDEIGPFLSLIGRADPKLKLPATSVKVESLDLKPRQKFLYLFDYGDEWHLEVEFLKNGHSEKARYPRIIDSKGSAPEQYQLSEEA